MKHASEFLPTMSRDLLSRSEKRRIALSAVVEAVLVANIQRFEPETQKDIRRLSQQYRS